MKLVSQCNFLVLGEGPTDDINDIILANRKKGLVLILVNQTQNFV